MTIDSIDVSLRTLDLSSVVTDPDAPGVPKRGYDFAKGDRRFFDHGAALEHAALEAILTGVRQSCRLSSGPYWASEGLWLVQAIGS